MPDYDFYHGLYSGQQVDSAVARALVGGQLDQDIAAIRAAVGSPLVANAAAEMTNINKIYVYTGSEAGYSTGHWYYYENGSWQDGGLYNSAAADSAMSDSSTNAVQNKVIKAYVDTTASELSGDIGDLRTDIDAAILAEQTRAEGVEALKAPLASPALTGTPTAPTAAAGDNSTKIATTAYADNAVAVEKARAEAVEATKADKSYADYILLREEEDRQILFGSVVEAAEDEYSELRSAPIHNAITIGQSVYPRMDRTRMAIDAIRGRTVAFNQLIPATAKSYSATLSTTQTYNILYANGLSIPTNGTHVYMISADLTRNIATNDRIDFMLWKQDQSYLYLMWENGAANGNRARIVKTTDGIIVSAALNNYAGNRGFTDGDTLSLDNVMLIDLTAQYGTTLADSIYAMEQATTGAGVAYVRQRMDLDYYAPNAGELKAPVVSGVGFTGKNLLHSAAVTITINGVTFTVEKNEDGEILSITASGTASANAALTLNNALQIDVPCVLSGNPSGGAGDWLLVAYNGTTYYNVSGGSTAAIPAGTYNVYILVYSGKNPNSAVFKPMISAGTDTEFEPYTAPTSLSIPSTRLDGVGAAQDILYVREDGENDYSLIKTAKMALVDMDDENLTWNKVEDARLTVGYVFRTTNVARKKGTNMACSIYPVVAEDGLTQVIATYGAGANKMIFQSSSSPYVYVIDGSYADASAFVAGMTTLGAQLAYELNTPITTTIAEHLTLAEVSAIAENGGIISVENSNGHIVQPDLTCDVVISRSAS